MKIVLLGSSGLAGSFFLKNLKSNKKIRLYNFNRKVNKNFDLNIEYFFKKILKTIRPDVILNFAGETNVDYCETNQLVALKNNAGVLRNFLKYFRGFFLHISTDQVYDGSRFYNKEYQAKPINFYGKSKLIGEKIISKYNNSLILRTNFFGDSIGKRKSLSDFFKQSFKENKKILLFQDLIFSPVTLETLYIVIMSIVEKNRITGIYNLGSSNCISKADFALKIAENIGYDAKHLMKVNSNEINGTRSQRPLNTSLDSKKLMNILNIELPSIEEEIRRIC